MNKQFTLGKIAASLTVLGGLCVVTPQAMAIVPLAGTNISNVATATYTDNTGNERVVTSNEVKTLVAQIGSFTLEADRSAQTTPNGQITFSHILTNTGNGSDKFAVKVEDLDEADSTFDFSTGGKFAIYLDRNQDGIADNQIALTPETLIELAAGESVGLVVVATTPNTATEGQFDKLKVTATAATTALYTDAAKSNIDTTKITSGAVVQMTKAANVSVTQAGQEIEYTLTFKNTGNSAASNVAIFDVLPSNVEFIPDSARYNGSNTVLTDSKDTNDKFHFDSSRGAFLFNIDSLAANTTGKLSFKVKVKENAQAGEVRNTAYIDPNGKPTNPTDPNSPSVPLEMIDVPSNPNTPPTDSTTVPSNPSIVVVQGTYSGAINDSLTDNFKDNEKPQQDTAANDEIVLAGKQGLALIFGQGASDPIVVHNRGNVTDTYNLTIDRTKQDSFAALPVGSTVEILKADGNTPLTDSNGDGIVDTGPILAGQNAQFVVRITLPSGEVLTNPVGVTLISTSVQKGEKDHLKLIISALEGNKVDLVHRPIANDPSSDKGTGQGDGNPVDTATTAPLAPQVFDITILNQGNVADNYIIRVPNVPENWTVEVFEKDAAGNCTSSKATNSGNIAPGAATSFCLVVTPPAGTPAGTTENIKVEINSPATGTKDDINFAVKVAEQRQLLWTPDRQGQVAPGGTIVYSHTLTNAGNVLEGDDSTYPLTIDWSSTLAGSNTSVYLDVNNDGNLSQNELISGNTAEERNAALKNLLLSAGTAAGLSQNESLTIFVKVEAPANATSGESDTTIVSFKPTGTNKPADVSITDRTVINLSQVRLIKTQALSENCSSLSSNYVTGDLKAKPGQCVYYKIVATNDGNMDATNITMSDMVPNYTQLLEGSLKPTTAQHNNRQISYRVGTLTPTAVATLEFAVKIDQ